jgi:glycosyltransferase involved in cell wall biosynthesis/ribosomal protein S18 acetylase RimI-like enzyme
VTERIRIAHVAAVDLTLRFLLLDQLRRLRDEGFEVVGISAPGPFTADLEREGISHLPWPGITRAWRPRSDLRAFLSLLRILRRERFHLVHTHTPKPGVLGRIAARVAGVPCIVNTVHGLYATPDDPLVRRTAVLAAEAFAAAFSDLELYQSEEDLRWARRRGLGRRKNVLLGNGVDLTTFDPGAVPPGRVDALRTELGIPEGALVVGTVGRLVREKGFVEFFAAARQIRAVLPEVRFLAVGPEEIEKGDAVGPEVLGAAREDVIVTGWRDDVRDLLALMDVFVLASWREGLPRSAIEAAAMGRPLVLTDIRGCREVARDGREAILVPPRDAARMADAILLLLRDPGLRERMGEAARKRAVARFDERRVIDAVVGHYRRLLAQERLLPVRTEDSLLIRWATSGDASAVARLHRENLPGSFLPSLGDGFLRRLYRALVTDPDGVLLVAQEGERVIGFVSGTRSVGGFYRRFYLRHGVPALLGALPRIVRGGILRRARETARYPKLSRDLPEAELLSIVVRPGHRGSGLGRRLVEALFDVFADRGVSEAKVVVASENEDAIRLYTETGFRHVEEIVIHDGVRSSILVRPCRS